MQMHVQPCIYTTTLPSEQAQCLHSVDELPCCIPPSRFNPSLYISPTSQQPCLPHNSHRTIHTGQGPARQTLHDAQTAVQDTDPGSLRVPRGKQSHEVELNVACGLPTELAHNCSAGQKQHMGDSTSIQTPSFWPKHRQHATAYLIS